MIEEDEYMLVRKKDSAVIIKRLFLSESGLSISPFGAERGDNEQIALILRGLLESEAGKRVSFGKLV
ncbi:MAG: hypothetical protein ABL868_08155 [Sulfuriferula sp.]